MKSKWRYLPEDSSETRLAGRIYAIAIRLDIGLLLGLHFSMPMTP
jgi:hypothetical protein